MAQELGAVASDKPARPLMVLSSPWEAQGWIQRASETVLSLWMPAAGQSLGSFRVESPAHPLTMLHPPWAPQDGWRWALIDAIVQTWMGGPSQSLSSFRVESPVHPLSLLVMPWEAQHGWLASYLDTVLRLWIAATTQTQSSIRLSERARPFPLLYTPWEPEIPAWLRVIFSPLDDPMAQTYRAAMALPDLRTPPLVLDALLGTDWLSARAQGWLTVGRLGPLVGASFGMTIATPVLRIEAQATGRLALTTQAPDILRLVTQG